MNIGKVPNEVLKKMVFDKLKNNRKEVLIRPGIGEDCCAVDFGEYVCVMSSDPITGAVNDVGRLSVHISCNDIASCGVEPLGLINTILAPEGTTEDELKQVMTQILETADSLGVDIIGGHTEITDTVSRFVIISTAIGKALKGKVVSTSGAKEGDHVVMTKSAGIEGTAIIAHDRQDELLKHFDVDFISTAKSFINQISVVKEGVIAGEFGVNSMHDITEGGVLGAIWEVCEASNTGVELYLNKIPVARETSEICRVFGIDPLKLISSGSMLITCGRGYELVQRLKENGINAAVIGKITGQKDRHLITDDGIQEILPPGSDELYKVI